MWLARFTDVAVYPGWQSPQFAPGETVGCGEAGGRPWQVPHEAGRAWVQTGALVESPPTKPPWQYEAEQEEPFHWGRAPPLVASGPKVSSTLPFAWAGVVGTTWHSVQATAGRSEPSWRCSWWAPTARSEVAVSPLVPFGGEAGSWGLVSVD
jgi:hypothetical protein